LLSKFRGDSGSAVSDFVLLVVPGSLLCLPIIDLFGIYQSSIVSEQVSYDIARYAALADVTQLEANLYSEQRYPLGRLIVDTDNLSCFTLADSKLQRQVTFWPEILAVHIQARAQCEN
jgi:hypothetical protein